MYDCWVKIAPDACDLNSKLLARAFQVPHLGKHILLSPCYRDELDIHSTQSGVFKETTNRKQKFEGF